MRHTPFPLVLFFVCCALNASREPQQERLGPKALQAIQEVLTQRETREAYVLEVQQELQKILAERKAREAQRAIREVLAQRETQKAREGREAEQKLENAIARIREKAEEEGRNQLATREYGNILATIEGERRFLRDAGQLNTPEQQRTVAMRQLNYLRRRERGV